MREHDIGAIPIGENDRLIGMVTDRDIVADVGALRNQIELALFYDGWLVLT
jgi:CBS domain-containing protein